MTQTITMHQLCLSTITMNQMLVTQLIDYLKYTNIYLLHHNWVLYKLLFSNLIIPAYIIKKKIYHMLISECFKFIFINEKTWAFFFSILLTRFVCFTTMLGYLLIRIYCIKSTSCRERLNQMKDINCIKINSRVLFGKPKNSITRISLRNVKNDTRNTWAAINDVLRKGKKIIVNIL